MSSISLLGIPHDENSSYLRGAADAPAYIRRELWSEASNLWTESGFDLGEAGTFADHGDIDFPLGRDPWEIIESKTRELQFPAIFLGGDHAVTHPILRGLRPHFPKLTILHFDAHPDIYHDFQGNPRSHASPFARIMEENLADRLIQVGIRTATGHQREQIRRFGVELHEAQHMHNGVELRFATPVYISLDIDSIDPAFAPGVSHRESGGLTPRQVVDLIHGIDRPIIGADIVEYNPRCDISNLTASVSSKMLKEIAGMMLQSEEKPQP